MGRADVCESDYLENEEIFADLVNGVLYQGEQVVKPFELEERDGELRSILGNGAKKTLRDKVKLWRGTAIAVLVVENQTRVDYRMVTRAMLAESMAYDKQWKKLRDKNREREKQQGDEFISGMQKEDKFIPVITIVIYYGKEKPWDGAKTLYELLDVEGNEERILPFVSNYHLNLFDYHDYEDFGQFHSELQPVFEFLRYAGNKESMKARLEQHREQYENLSSQAKILLTELTNIKEIPGVGEEEFKKGDFSMCKAFEDMREEGFIEGEKVGRTEGEKVGRTEGEKIGRAEGEKIGRAEGEKVGRAEGEKIGRTEGIKEGRAEEIIDTGREFKLTEEEILQRLQNKLGISQEKAEEYYKIYRGKQTVK